jgi:hypothetical protein
MTNRGHGFIVEVKGRRRPNADFTSRAGDARRSGKADPAPIAGHVALTFDDSKGRIEARLGVVCVAQISINPAGGGYLWTCFLPMLRRVPAPAADLDKAKSAVDHQVRQWCEAAHVVSVRKRGAA